jgi:hypothetical protein
VKADLTRNSFDPLKHFSRVLMQQGRVQVDADWNEQAGILLHLMRRMAADLFGTRSGADGGFQIGALQAAKAVANDFRIAPGTYYVDGILCELEATPVSVVSFDPENPQQLVVSNWTVDGVSFQAKQYLEISDAAGAVASVGCQVQQVDYAKRLLTVDTDLSALANAASPVVRRLTSYLSQADLPKPPALPGSGTSYQVYLDVWERPITCLEDDSIREVALNGPDTAARTRVVWQVKALPDQDSCLPQTTLTERLQPRNRGLLRARVQPTLASTDPCTVSPDSHYAGAENQLYRVEVHGGGSQDEASPPSFKWSRENGAVTFPILKLSTGDNQTTVMLGNLGRDDRFGLEVGDYVEIQDDWSVLSGTTGPLLQVQGIDSGNLSVTLAGNTTVGVGADPALHPLLRRWDHKPGDRAQGGLTIGKDGAALIPAADAQGASPWLELEQGVQVQFDLVGKPQFRSGDYWLIPARVATGDVLWPSETASDARGNSVTNPAAVPPDGVDHHYAPLAIVSVDPNGQLQVQPCEGYVVRRPQPVPRPAPRPRQPAPAPPAPAAGRT